MNDENVLIQRTDDGWTEEVLEIFASMHCE